MTSRERPAALTLSPPILGLKLFAILAGSLASALVLQRFVGPAWLARRKDEIEGFNILLVFVFVAGVMEHVAERCWAAPGQMLALGALACAVSLGVLGLTMLVFGWAGRDRVLVLGLMASQRNMGLMFAGTAGVLPEIVWLYIALNQFPIYLTPQALKPLARGIARRARAARATE